MIAPEETERRVNAYNSGKTDQELARVLGLPCSTVTSWRTGAGLSRNQKPGLRSRWTDEEKWKLRKLASSHTRDEIALALGRAPRSVEQMAHRMRIKIKKIRRRVIRTGPAPKSEHGRKITDKERYKLALLQGLFKKGRAMVPTATAEEIINAAIEAIRIGYAKKFIDGTEL